MYTRPDAQGQCLDLHTIVNRMILPTSYPDNVPMSPCSGSLEGLTIRRGIVTAHKLRKSYFLGVSAER